MDVLHDNSWADWLHINEKVTNVPDYVKKYTPLDKEAASELSDSQFADPGKRMFPIESPAGTWLSAAYFALNRDGIKKSSQAHIQNNIKQAAAIYNIDIEDAMDKISAAEKTTEHVAWMDGNNPRMPINTPTEIYKAAEYFNEYRYRFTDEERHTIATNIVKRANELVMDIEGLNRAVLADANYGIMDRVQLMDEILQRTHIIKDAEMALAVGNLNILIGNLPIESEDALHKIAEIVQAVDRIEGIDRDVRHSKRMDINDVLYGQSIRKTSEAVNDAVKLNRYIFSATKLASLNPAIYGNILGEQFEASVIVDGKIDRVKLASKLSDLPIEDRASLEEYIQESLS